jgi:tyrosine-protein kinase Etk/Wzc
LLGLLLSTLAACVHSRGQWRLHAPREVEQQLGVAVMAAVPHSAAQQSCWAKLGGDTPMPAPALLQLAAPQDGALESLRRVRTLVQRALPVLDHPVIVITGPGARVGRTFVAANLAALLAATGRQVLLVDADLRAGCLHRALAAEGGPGLAEFLTGQHDAAAIVRAQVLPHVDLIPAGAPHPNPADLLAQDRLAALLQAVAQRYDYVVVDTSPLLTAADAQAVAALGAATICVVRNRVTSAVEIEEAARQLRQAGAPIAGFIVNACRLRPARPGLRIGRTTAA